MSIHLQISSCNYPPSRQPLCPDLVSFQHPYSRPPFNPSSAIPPPPAVELSSSATQTFFSSPSPSFNTGVGRFFFSPFVNPLSFRLHYRPSQPSNPSTSFPGIFKNHQSDLSFSFYFYLSLLPFSKGWKYLDIGETRLFSSR